MHKGGEEGGREERKEEWREGERSVTQWLRALLFFQRKNW